MPHEPVVDDSEFSVLIEPIREEGEKLNTYVRTRRAVLAGSPLYNFSRTQLTQAGLMGPWKFNFTESAIASGFAAGVLWLVTYLFPGNVVQPVVAVRDGLWGRTFDECFLLMPEIQSWIIVLIVPLATMFLAKIVGWGSLRSKDVNRERVRASTFAFLYLEGAHGLIPDVLWAVGVSVIFGLSEGAIQANFYVITLGVSCSLIGMILGHRMMNLVIPSRLFLVNGYRSFEKSMFAVPKDDSQASWVRYELSTLFGSALALLVSIVCLLALSFALALPLSLLKTAIGSPRIALVGGLAGPSSVNPPLENDGGNEVSGQARSPASKVLDYLRIDQALAKRYEKEVSPHLMTGDKTGDYSAARLPMAAIRPEFDLNALACEAAIETERDRDVSHLAAEKTACEFLRARSNLLDAIGQAINGVGSFEEIGPATEEFQAKLKAVNGVDWF